MSTYEYLLTHEIKPSQQRICLMEFLLKHRIHPTAEEVYSRLSPSMPTLSKTTVYNTLKLFVQKGAAQMLTIDERNACFDADITKHAHFLCKECGKVYDLHEVPSHWQQLPEDTLGHLIDEVQLYYRGTCRKCAEKQAKKKLKPTK